MSLGALATWLAYSRRYHNSPNGARTSCPPASEARSDFAGRVRLEEVRAARSGGQDVRAPSWNLRQSVLLQTPIEGAAAQAQSFRCAVRVTIKASQSLRNQQPLGVIETHFFQAS
ncbi:MAG: hypothetical protein QOG23_2008 [Blastocatellia bacterium]|nr:hypothetical protein [Blastocatellia bacterium]